MASSAFNKRCTALGIVAALACLAAGARAVFPPLCDGMWIPSGASFDMVSSATTADSSCTFVGANTTGTIGGKSMTGVLTTEGSSHMFKAVTSSGGKYWASLSEDKATLTFWSKPVPSSIDQRPVYTWFRVDPPIMGNSASPFTLGEYATLDSLVKLSCDTPMTAHAIAGCKLMVADGSSYKLATTPLVVVPLNSTLEDHQWWTAYTNTGSSLTLRELWGMIYIYNTKPTEKISSLMLAKLYPQRRPCVGAGCKRFRA